MIQATEQSPTVSTSGGTNRQAGSASGQRGAKGQPGSKAAGATEPEISCNGCVVSCQPSPQSDRLPGSFTEAPRRARAAEEWPHRGLLDNAAGIRHRRSVCRLRYDTRQRISTQFLGRHAPAAEDCRGRRLPAAADYCRPATGGSAVARLAPSNQTSPRGIWAVGGSRRISANPVTDLPHPLSPTSAGVWNGRFAMPRTLPFVQCGVTRRISQNSTVYLEISVSCGPSGNSSGATLFSQPREVLSSVAGELR